MKRNGFIIAVAAALIVIFGSQLFIFQVKQWQVAMVTTFGKVTGEPVTTPGAHFCWPRPVQDVYLLDQRIQNFESRFEETKLGDENIILMSVYVGWRITDPKLYYSGFGNASKAAEKRLADCVQTVQSSVISKCALSDLVCADESKIKFTQIESNIQTSVQQMVKAQKYGVEIEFVQIRKIGLPESITKSVFERMKTDRNFLINKIQTEGRTKAQTVRTDADNEAAKIIADAEYQAQAIRGDGEAQAAKYISVFTNNPELAILNIKLNALPLFFKENTTLILDPSTPPLDVLIKGYTPSTNSEPAKK